jgi:hypothetical protein
VLLFVDALVARGKQAITAIKKILTPWKSIKLGGKPIEQVITAIKEKGNEISDYARSMMSDPAFCVLRVEFLTDLVILTPADLGFTENPRTGEFMTKEFLAEWSSKNLDGYVIELCYPEVGSQLRLQYQDQPKGEVLWIAMEPITVSGGRPSVFYVECLDVGDRWLSSYWVYPGDRWPLARCIVFRLRKIQS